MAKSAAASKIPLKTRFAAWWEGYDASDYHAHLSGESQAPAVPQTRKEPPALPAEESAAIEAAAERMPDAWLQPRIDLAQLIWGEGYCGPGGPEQIIAMSKLLALNSEMSLLYLGAGVGGPARALAKEFGVWVSGYESSATQVQVGNDLSTRAGLSKKAELTVADPSAAHPFNRHFDRAIIQGFLYQSKDFVHWLEAVHETLKPDSLLLVSGLYLRNEEDHADPGVVAWLGHEGNRAHQITVDELLDGLAKTHFKVRVNEDTSAEYLSLIQQAWASAGTVVARLMADPQTQGHARILLREAELWNHRSKLIERGLLQYRRIVGQKLD